MENPSALRARPAGKTQFRGRTMEEVEALYHRHVDTVYGVCYSLMGNRSDAEDAVQAVFLKVMKDRTPFSDFEHEKAWLITTARNHCKDMHRQW